VRTLANHGRHTKYTHLVEGVNSRLDTLQAAILRVKLRHLEAWNERRRQIAALYGELLSVPGIGLPVARPDTEPVWHLYVIQVADRELVQSRLSAAGIDSGVHYPVPLHLQPAYADLGMGAGSFPVTENAAARILSLPIYAELTDEQVRRIASIVIDAVQTI
jgi:dTDP-4-amino-4,6-dideoxygalactose transaminase